LGTVDVIDLPRREDLLQKPLNGVFGQNTDAHKWFPFKRTLRNFLERKFLKNLQRTFTAKNYRFWKNILSLHKVRDS
jgi:hypothetical protein